MGLLTRTMWYPRVDAYEMIPVNSPAVLIYLRILLALVETMTAKNRIDFKSLDRKKLLQLEDQLRVHYVPVPVVIEDEWTVIDEFGGKRKTMKSSSFRKVILSHTKARPRWEAVLLSLRAR